MNTISKLRKKKIIFKCFIMSDQYRFKLYLQRDKVILIRTQLTFFGFDSVRP